MNIDQIILKNIYARIKWDVRVSIADVKIDVYHGHVILSGYFDKSYRHAAALEIIRTTSGVKDIHDLSKVVPDFYRTDLEFVALIKNQIRAFNFLPGEWIEVDAADGVVKLEGVVYRPRLKAFADTIAWELSGIQDCMNMIEVQAPPSTILQKKWVGLPEHENQQKAM